MCCSQLLQLAVLWCSSLLCCALCVVHCALCVMCCDLHVVCCDLHVVHCALCVICMWCVVICVRFLVLCVWCFFLHDVVHIAHCVVHIAHCVVHLVILTVPVAGPTSCMPCPVWCVWTRYCVLASAALCAQFYPTTLSIVHLGQASPTNFATGLCDVAVSMFCWHSCHVVRIVSLRRLPFIAWQQQ